MGNDGEATKRKRQGTLLPCGHCNARISRNVAECPWCGTSRRVGSEPGLRRRVSLGALLMLVTIGAVLCALVALSG